MISQPVSDTVFFLFDRRFVNWQIVTTVWRSLLPPYSSLCLPRRVILQMGTALSFDTPVIIYQSTRCHTPRHLSLHQSCALSPAKCHYTPWHTSMEGETRIMATALMRVGMSRRIMDPHKEANHLGVPPPFHSKENFLDKSEQETC